MDIQISAAYNSKAIQVAMPFILGLLFAAILTVIAWKEDCSDSKWSDDPRLKALRYGLLGLIAAVIADWKSLFGELHIARIEFVLLYVAGFVLGVVVTLAILAVIILLISSEGHRLEDTIHFVFSGYGPWREQKQSRTDFGNTVRRRIESVVSYYRRIGGLISDAMAANILATLNVLQDPIVHTADDACTRILESIGPIVEFALPQITPRSVNSNLMLAMPIAELERNDKVALSFAWPHADGEGYSHGLVLTCYARPHDTTAPANLALPVEDSRLAGWEDRVLPGAPKAFLTQTHAIFNSDGLEFGEQVPRDIRDQIRAYFRRQNFEFFISLIIPVRLKDHPIGVVNIEGQLKHGEALPDDQEVDFLKRVLHPICATLGMLASQSNGLWPQEE